MPIFVEWKWKEATRTYLVIFHFDDDYSKKNLRTQTMKFEDEKLLNPELRYYTPAVLHFASDDHFRRKFQIRSVTTWAPSHVELALLTEVLTYANLINGLKEETKRALMDKLMMLSFFKGWKLWFHLVEKRREEMGLEQTSFESARERVEADLDERVRELLLGYQDDYLSLRKTLKDGKVLCTDYVTGTSASTLRNTQFMCFEICPEYIDYLKEILKPYM